MAPRGRFWVSVREDPASRTPQPRFTPRNQEYAFIEKDPKFFYGLKAVNRKRTHARGYGHGP